MRKEVSVGPFPPISVPNDGIDALGQEREGEKAFSVPLYRNLIGDFDEHDDDVVPLEGEGGEERSKCVLLGTVGEDHVEPNTCLNVESWRGQVLRCI